MLLKGAHIECATPIPKTFGRGIQDQNTINQCLSLFCLLSKETLW